MTPPESRLDHLECSACDATAAPDRLHNLCDCGAPWLARYRSPGPGPWIDPTQPGMWRYAALLPHRGQIVTLGEGRTPVVDAPRLARSLDLAWLGIKDESRNPTTSFKARGLSAAVTMATGLGAKGLAIPTAGNAGGALAAYGARAGLPVDVFMPHDTPRAFELEARLHGARVHRIDGLIDTCGAHVREGAEAGRWFDVSTLKEPYRLEGKKTMGFEIAELSRGPDVVLYPTGGGTGLIGIGKAFAELAELGSPARLPRMVAVQVEGCAPIVRAFHAGAETATPWENASTLAYGLRVPRAVGDRLMLETLRRSQGTALAVPETAMLAGMLEVARMEGVPAGPETGALWAAARTLRDGGWIRDDDRVLLVSTGSSHKYTDAVEVALDG